MEKLIELLNEYERSKWYEWLWEIKEWIPYFDDELPRTKAYISVLICAKPYGFIKWLVDNDKTNKHEVHLLWTDDMEYNYSEEELILMELAIQDNPIDFLLNILK